MKREKGRIAALLAFVFSLALAFALPGFAAAEAAGREVNHYNVVLVIDKSGSLRNGKGQGTDPDGLRFDAMRLFLGLLTERGNNVGVVVFDEQIRYDSGLKAMESMEDKKALIREAESFTPSYDTDIGSAVLRATELLRGMREENGLPCMILLLTDGKTDFSEGAKWMRKTGSWQNATRALEAAKEEGITINGILLNVDGLAEGGEVELGIYTQGTNGSFEEVTRPEDLSAAFRHFYAIINRAEYSGAEAVVFSDEGAAEKDFIVPGFGVEEVNVVVEHEAPRDGGSLDGLVKIKVVQPDGGEFDITGHELFSSRYLLVKIPRPTIGRWVVSLRGKPGDTADITMVYNASMSVELTSEGARRGYTAYKPSRFTARVTDPSAPELTEENLKDLTAVIELEEKSTGRVWRYPMEVADGGYVCDAAFPTGGDFSVSALVGTAGFEVRSNTLDAAVQLRRLTAKVWTVDDMFRYGRFRDDCWELELDELFDVPREAEIQYTLSDDCDGALSIENGVLRARFRGTDTADFTLTATDAAGQSASIPFKLKIPAVAASTEKITSMVKYGSFGDGVWELELDKLFTDPKGTAVDYTLSDDYGGALTVEDGVLRMDIRRLRKAEFTLTATDIFEHSAEIAFELTLPGPAAAVASISETVKTGLFQEDVWERRIEGLFRDPKGTALRCELTDDLGGAAKLEDGVLRVNCRGIGKDASFSLRATDEYDMSAELPVRLTERYVTPYYILQALLVLAGLGALIWLVVWLRRRYY